jgi:hypothetical protein
MLQQRPNTFAQTNLSPSFFACDKAADHTFRVGDDPGVNYRQHRPAERIFPFLSKLGGDHSTHAHYVKAARLTIPTPAPLTILRISRLSVES